MQKIGKKSLLMIVVALSTISIVSSAIAVFDLVSTGTQIVSITTPTSATIIGGDVNGNSSAFVVASNNQSATFTLPDLTTSGATNTIHIIVQNTGSVSEQFQINAQSSNGMVANVNAMWIGGMGGNNIQIASGATATAAVTVTAVGSGVTTITVSITG
jgi:hypothetical protein